MCRAGHWQALAHRLIPLLPPQLWLTSGRVRTLSQLVRKSAQVIAVTIAQDGDSDRNCEEHGFKNLELQARDIEDPPIAKNSIVLRF